MAKALAVLLLALIAAGCGGDDEPSRPPSELTGVIVAVKGEGSEVRSFTLEAEGEEHEILIASELDYGFDLAHLREHERTGEPVECRLFERDGRLYALTIEDVGLARQ